MDRLVASAFFLMYSLVNVSKSTVTVFTLKAACSLSWHHQQRVNRSESSSRPSLSYDPWWQ